MRLIRSSLRIPHGGTVRTASAVLALSIGAACGGGAAAPTPTAVPAAATVGAAPAASPQRPALASPIASPSSVVSSGSSATSAPSSSSTDVSGSTNYDVQAGDTLAIIAEKQYGDASQWRRIYDANKDAIGADPDKLKLGMTLKIPPKQ